MCQPRPNRHAVLSHIFGAAAHRCQSRAAHSCAAMPQVMKPQSHPRCVLMHESDRNGTLSSVIKVAFMGAEPRSAATSAGLSCWYDDIRHPPMSLALGLRATSAVRRCCRGPFRITGNGVAPKVSGRYLLRATSCRDVRLAVPPLARCPISGRPAAAALAGELCGALRDGGERRDLLPPA